MTGARIVFLCIGVVGLVAVGLSLLPIGLGILGLFGVLADVSAAENRQIGQGFLMFGLAPLLPGIALLGVGSIGFFAVRPK